MSLIQTQRTSQNKPSEHGRPVTSLKSCDDKIKRKSSPSQTQATSQNKPSEHLRGKEKY